MDAKMWYWLILILWIIFGAGEWFITDPTAVTRWRRGGNIVLIILLVLIGFIIAGSPMK